MCLSLMYVLSAFAKVNLIINTFYEFLEHDMNNSF